MFEKLMLIRNDCLDNLGMSDPPNPSYGFYYNVYIHYDEENGDQDLFPNGWAYGQGTDPFGLPYLTVPHGGIYSPTPQWDQTANFREIARNGMKVRELQKKKFAHYKSPLGKKLSQNLP